MLRTIIRISKRGLLICLLSMLFVNSAMSSYEVGAESNHYWLVYKLGQIKRSDQEGAKRLLAEIPDGSIIEVPVSWSASLCDFNKNLVDYTDKIKRDVVVCVYIGSIRKSYD